MATPKKTQAVLIEELSKKIEELEERLDEVENNEPDVLSESDVREIAVDAISDNADIPSEDKIRDIANDVLSDSDYCDEEKAEKIAERAIENADLVTNENLTDQIADSIRNNPDVELAVEAAIVDILDRRNEVAELIQNAVLNGQATEPKGRLDGAIHDLLTSADSLLSKTLQDRIGHAAKENADKPAGAAQTADIEALQQRLDNHKKELLTLSAAQDQQAKTARETATAIRNEVTQISVNLDTRISREARAAIDRADRLVNEINSLSGYIRDLRTSQSNLLSRIDNIHMTLSDTIKAQEKRLKVNTSDVNVLADSIALHRRDVGNEVLSLRLQLKELSDRYDRMVKDAEAKAVTAAPAKMDLKSEANSAGYRIAVRQVTKLTHEPLVARFCQMSPGDADMLKLLGASEIGRSMIGALMSVGVDYVGQQLPANYAAVAKNLSKEFRVSAMTDTADFAMDIIMEPLRAVICETIAKKKTGVSADVLQESAPVVAEVPHVEELAFTLTSDQAAA